MATHADKQDYPHTPIKITPAFGFSYISERAIREGLGRRQFGRQEMEKVEQWFAQYEPQPACVFCGSPTVRRWDHLISIREDGETVLGNMVFACQPCDDSKGKVPFKEWMRGKSPKSPKMRGIRDFEERIRRLNAYMQAFEYNPTTLEQRLDADQLSILNRIHKDLTRLRNKVNTFIERYQTQRAQDNLN